MNTEQNTPSDASTDVSPESKDAAIKALAIIGFIAVVIISMWALVQVVRFAPNTFSTLASIAESIYAVEEDFSVTPQKNVVNSGEAFVLSWSTMRADGTYTFTYECVDGVSAEVRDANNTIATIACDTTVSVGEDVSDVEVIISSEKRRFADVPYHVAFVRENGDETTSSDIITVVNASITQSADIALENEGEVESETDENEEVETPTTPATPAVPTTRTVPTTVTSLTVSDPNGFADLQVTYLGVGRLDDDGDFIPASTLDNDERGAVRFEVRNIGTKTSDEWEFDAKLPTTPSFTYSSDDQDELRPNERAVITVGFSPEGTGAKTVQVVVTGGNDTRTLNNSFTRTATVTN